MPFQKGISGNPGGRPKRGWTWAGLLEEVGEEIEEKTGKKFRDLVSRRLWYEAVNGNLVAVKEILNRMDGMPTQKHELQYNPQEELQKVIEIVKNGASQISTTDQYLIQE